MLLLISILIILTIIEFLRLVIEAGRYVQEYIPKPMSPEAKAMFS
jgi:hypothetical protein